MNNISDVNLNYLSKEDLEELKIFITRGQREYEKAVLLHSKQKTLNEQLGHNNYVMKTTRNLNTITIVTTLELIKEVIIVMGDNPIRRTFSKNPYNLILKEIEAALDNPNIDSLMLIIEQYKRILEINCYSKHRKKERTIRKKHNEFQKVISKKQR